MSTMKITPTDTAAQSEKARTEQLRKSFISANEEVGKGVSKLLHDLADNKRPEFEAYIKDRLLNTARNFIALRDKRANNMTLAEFNAKPARNPDESDKDYNRRCDLRTTFDLSLIYALTDHPQPKAESDKEHWEWEKNKNRPAFKITLKKTADTTAAKMAKEKVERVVQQFIFKMMDKVIDLLVRKPQYTAKLVSNSYDSGVLEADIRIDFKDKTGFRTHLILKTNYRGNRPYWQYPLSFHDVSLTPGAVRAGTSQYDILHAWDIPVWKPDKSKKVVKRNRWDTVKTGCVIVTKERKLAFVETVRIPKEDKGETKLWNDTLRFMENKIKELDRQDTDNMGKAKYKAWQEERDAAWRTAHEYKYTTMPQLKKGMNKAFVVYPDGSREKLSADQIDYIAAKIDVSDLSVHKSDIKDDLKSIIIGSSYTEETDGTIHREKYNATDIPDINEWVESNYNARPAALRRMAFERLAKVMTVEQDEPEAEGGDE